jgi:REP element-mobilizing transposase RayT
VLHRAREPVAGLQPLLVTLRVREDVPSLHGRAFVEEFRRSLAVARERGDFRVVHYALRHDHVHLIVEARGKRALASGMKSVAARLARAMNRASARSGPVVDGRFHSRVLRTPRDVRDALAFVLIDRRGGGASSAGAFDGWKQGRGRPRRGASGAPEVAPARSWLLRLGWRRHGLLDPREVPEPPPVLPPWLE